MNIKEYPKVDDVRTGEVFLLDGPRGTKTIPADKFEFSGSGAGYANSIVNEYSLGDHLTSEQSADIRNGAFKLVRVGGYWTINGRKYWAAHADYKLRKGTTFLTAHHMLVVPDSCFYNTVYSSTDDNSSGYANCAIKRTGLSKALDIVSGDFGSDHILPYSNVYCIGYSGPDYVGSKWYSDQKIDIMCEHMVYGSHICGKSNAGVDPGTDTTQLALFRTRPDLIVDSNNTNYWLRDIATTKSVIFVDGRGISNSVRGNTNLGIRPAFLVY